jgi:cytochrome c biogenesis protein CcdA/thiol-disulfide isomerase/thioredoxin
MNTALISICLGFLEGFVLILSPCILSIIPLIFAGSVVGSKKRAFGIILGFIFTFAVFALFAHQLVQYFGIDLNFVRYTAYALLFIFALVLLSNYLTERFTHLTQNISALGTFFIVPDSSEGLLNGIFLGGLMALIWTPCAGPILATVIVQIAIQKTTVISFLTLLSFALGAGIPVFLIILYGFKIRDTFTFFKTHSIRIRKVLGIIILLNLGYMILQESGVRPLTVVSQSNIRTANYLEGGLWRPYKAPEIGGIEEWINASALKISALKGRVVLIDFWTYSCINCIRTIPYLNDWYKKYHQQGLVIIGVHTPEFDFEKNATNVQNAVRRYGIKYPVALDNLFVTWQNFANHYWPAHYLINQNGEVVYEHFGEGNYETTENNIRFLLGGDKINPPINSEEVQNNNLTPETYLGYERADTNFSPVLTPNHSSEYHFTDKLASDAWELEGFWQVNADKISATQANASLRIHFNARKIFLVMGSRTKNNVPVSLLLNGKPLLITQQGRSVINSQLVVDKYFLYEAISLPKFSHGVLQITPQEPGLDIYTITFGS